MKRGQESPHSWHAMHIQKKDINVLKTNYNLHIEYIKRGKDTHMLHLNRLLSFSDYYFLRKSNGIIFLCDSTNIDSLKHLEKFIDNAKQVNNHFYMCIVTSKVDLVSQRVISYDEGYASANKINCKYFEISTYDYGQVSNVINLMVDEILHVSKFDKTVVLNYDPYNDSENGGCMGRNTCFI